MVNLIPQAFRIGPEILQLRVRKLRRMQVKNIGSAESPVQQR
jgi:hypothetical protein